MRWGMFAMGTMLILHGVALIFAPDGLLPRAYGEGLYFKAVSGLFGHSIAQTVWVMLYLSLGVAFVRIGLPWGGKRKEKQ